MIHPSYVDLMEVVNKDVEEGETPVINSRYSIVMATAKRARQIVDGDEPLVKVSRGEKPLSIAVDELNQGEIRILAEDEVEEEYILPGSEEADLEDGSGIGEEDEDDFSAPGETAEETMPELSSDGYAEDTAEDYVQEEEELSEEEPLEEESLEEEPLEEELLEEEPLKEDSLKEEFPEEGADEEEMLNGEPAEEMIPAEEAGAEA